MSRKEAMHIGFDISQTGSEKAGCGYYSDAMIRAMLEIAPQNSYSLFPTFGDFYYDASMPYRNPFPGKDVRYGPRQVTRELASSFWNGDGVEHQLATPDIIHANNFWCPVQLRSSRLVYTVYDLGFAVHPEWTTERNRVGCFEGVFRAATVADWIVAISDASRNDFLAAFPRFPEERTSVIHPCSRFMDSSVEGKRPRQLDQLAPDGFWLSVGTVEPRKNHRRLVDAYKRYLALGGRAMPLVIAGGKGWLMDGFRDELAAMGIAQHVILTGYVSDEELIWLYRKCYANLYPSLFEGFGLPVLEGMQFGAATMVSRIPSSSEVAGDAAISLDPKNTEEWAQAMLRLAGDEIERERLRSQAQSRAAHFAWRTSASSLLEVYGLALSHPKRSVPA
jgi:glycosyltransferase involved in cell wall biosynthesis